MPTPLLRCSKLGITAPLSGTLRGLHLPRNAPGSRADSVLLVQIPSVVRKTSQSLRRGCWHLRSDRPSGSIGEVTVGREAVRQSVFTLGGRRRVAATAASPKTAANPNKTA